MLCCRYGQPTASTTEDAMHAVGNLAVTAYQANNLGIKAIAKHTAKNTGKAVLEDYRKSKGIKLPSPEQELLPPIDKEPPPPTQH